MNKIHLQNVLSYSFKPVYLLKSLKMKFFLALLSYIFPPGHRADLWKSWFFFRANRYSAGVNLLKVNNGNHWKNCEILSKLTNSVKLNFEEIRNIKSGISIVEFEQITIGLIGRLFDAIFLNVVTCKVAVVLFVFMLFLFCFVIFNCFSKNILVDYCPTYLELAAWKHR